MTMSRALVFCLLFFALGACAFTPHQVTLAPKTSFSSDSSGSGTSIYLEIIDDRDDTTVGHRGAGTMGSKITAPNLMNTLRTNLRDGFLKKGYQIVDAESAANANVTIKLRAFKYYVETGFFSGGENINAVLVLEALKAGGDYRNTYRYKDEERILIVQTGDSLDESLNAALATIMTQLMSDSKLHAFLTN